MRNARKLAALLLAATLTLALSVTCLAAVDDTGFSDVAAGAWYADAVAYVKKQGIMNGTSDTTFAPDATTTRGQMAAILYRAVGSPAVSGTGFSDVADTAYYVQAVRWANANGIITGYEDGTFRANQTITRQQMTAILWRYAGSPSAATADISDAGSVSSYAVGAVNWAVANNIVALISSRTFAPQDPASRAQIAAAVMNLNRSTQTPAPTPDTTPNSGGKVLAAYFSATNTTKPLAEYIADGLDADLYEIVPETPYTSADLNYNDSSSRTTAEMNDSSARPAISGNVDNMEQYDIVFIGYPIWWGQAPRIISTFLESYDFSGKTIVPFCTSGSSGIGSSAQNLRSLTDGAAWLDGQRFGSGTSRSTMIAWVNGLGLNITAE